MFGRHPGSGHVTCGAYPPDYVPPDPSNVVLWIDASQGLGDVPRALMDVDRPTPTSAAGARAVRAAGFSIAPRPLMASWMAVAGPSTPPLAVSAGVAANGVYGLRRQNARTLIALSDAAGSAGLTGTWGPLGRLPSERS